MSTGTDTLPEDVIAEEDESTTQSVAGLPKRFRVGDLLIPAVCVAIVSALLAYLHTADLSPIVAASVSDSQIQRQASAHIGISLLITAIVLVVAITLGILVTRPKLRWISPGVLAFANAGQAVPSVGLIAIIALVGLFGGVGLPVVVFTLSLYAILPVLRNTIVGIEQVDPGVIDAARGVGMSNLDILRRVEFVLAIPVIAAGARTALVLAVATVPFGDYVGAGGLGGMLFAGIKLNRPVTLVTAALLIAVLALLLDWAGAMVEKILTPRGMH